MRDGVFHKRMAASFGASVVALSGLPAIVHAQATPAPPPPPPPPVGSEPTREQVTPQTFTTPIKPHKRVDSSDVADLAPCPLNTSNLHVTISSVNFTGPGNAPLAPQIQKTLAGVGPTVSGDAPIREVCQIRDRANSALRQAGYIASVQIVPQDMSSGVLQLTVVTAHFSDIRVHGDPGPYRKLMDDRIAQLMALDPLNELDAERILLITGDVPGLDVKLSLRSAGTTPGAVIGDLTVAHIPYRVQVNVNSLGSEQIGRDSAYARLELYGLTGHSDVTYLGVSDTFQSKEQQVVQIGHTMGIGKKGATIGASYIFARSRPDLAGIDLRTDSSIGNIEYYRPLIRTVSRDLLFYGGLDIVEQKTQVFGSGKRVPLNLDKIRVGYIKLSAAMHNPGLGGDGFVFRGDVEVRKGFDILGASQPGNRYLSRLDADPSATVLRANADASLGLGSIFSVAGVLRTQWTNKELLNYEQFAVGNLTIGRGYDPGANTADSAVAWRAELRGEFARASAMKGEGFIFYDSAHIWRNVKAPATGPKIPDPENDRTLASYGAGVRFILPGRWVAEITYAKPLDKALKALTIQDGPPPPRIMFSITTQFPSSY